jgi:exopolyphosphatase/guanosine-5'-triphosphate,3'-diphosphate pyrophosphatase
VVRRESRVTGLGRGLGVSCCLANEAIERVAAVVGEYVEAASALGAETMRAIATSAVREAANGDAFLAELRERFSLEAEIIDGLEEALLTYRGAISGGYVSAPTLVVDIGGGSTELIVGSTYDPDFRVSLPIGVVRHTERHVKADPPSAIELESLASDVGALVNEQLSAHPGLSASQCVAVAGTPALLASIDLALEAVDPSAIEGHRLSLETVQNLCSRLSSLPLAERRQLRGIDPDRAPYIVAGVITLVKVMRSFNLQEVIVSDRDILYGAALAAAKQPSVV